MKDHLPEVLKSSRGAELGKNYQAETFWQAISLGEKPM